MTLKLEPSRKLSAIAACGLVLLLLQSSLAQDAVGTSALESPTSDTAPADTSSADSIASVSSIDASSPGDSTVADSSGTNAAPSDNATADISPSDKIAPPKPTAKPAPNRAAERHAKDQELEGKAVQATQKSKAPIAAQVVRPTNPIRMRNAPTAADGKKPPLSMHIEDRAPTAPRPKSKSSLVAVGSAAAAEVPAAGHRILESIEFDEVTLADAMKVFAEESGLNVITSSDAGKTKITVYLKNVTALDALEAIVKTNGLFYRIEANSGIVRIATLKEYEKDLASFREEQTRVFTLLYPNPIAVAQVIQQVFGNRVQMNRADADVDDLIDLSRRFNRFDLVDGRSLGLGGSNSAGKVNNQQNSGGALGMNGLGRAGNLGGFGGPGAMGGGYGLPVSQRNTNNNAVDRDRELLNDMSAEEIQVIENQVAENGELGEEARSDLLQRREATIYVSTIRRNNQVIVRTGDTRSMEQISQLIAQLDVPTPTVLLEVKVLRILLADGFNSSFEFLGAHNDASTAWSDGSLSPAFPGANTAARTLGNGLGVGGSIPGALTFRMVDDAFRFRMQLLESKNCVTALATPLILTANNEVSRIFVGDTLPFTVGFTPSQVLSSVSAVNGAVAATPITELRDVGQSLLITPNINADRTVTLRVIEENSERVLSGSSIPVPATSGSGVTNVSVDTVRRRTISGTIVAQDGMAVALGGLIEEQVSEARDQMPVLGNIPGLGIFFRRQATNRSRSELVVIVRPYVFNTPTESAATSEMLLGELSTHPARPKAAGAAQDSMPCRVTRSDAECSQRAKLFRLHNRALTTH